MLLESRKTFINIDHIHADDEFWKRYVTCISDNPELLTGVVCGIPLTITVAQQYNRLFLSRVYPIFLGSPDPLPMQLIQAFEAILEANRQYLNVLARAEKRPRISPSQHGAQAATRDEEQDEDANVPVLHDSMTRVLS
jgi:hypothetical protein